MSSSQFCPSSPIDPLRGSLTKFLLFCESHFSIWLPSSLEQPVGPPGAAACFRWQVATILLLSATFISDHTANRLEGHAGLFQLFLLSSCGLFLALPSLRILALAWCLLVSAWELGAREAGPLLSRVASGSCTGLAVLPFHTSSGMCWSLSVLIIIFIPPAPNPYYLIP